MIMMIMTIMIIMMMIYPPKAQDRPTTQLKDRHCPRRLRSLGSTDP